MLTVHMIGNAHIDPVWLWRWPAGVGEVLATCRTACDMLDEVPEAVFTRSDVWVYQRIEEIDPALFSRVRRHIETGRWAVVGGWYIQPDCNFPTEESFLKHIAAGKRFFGGGLGVNVTVGYNVDSFGHAASLPRILADNGFDSYVMMRPMAQEMALPGNLFRWRSTEEAGGVREVLTWRIPVAYCTAAEDLGDHVRAAIASAVPGVDHVMCFYGVGDHGGGPSREQIAWIGAHRDAFPGARLSFSHPRTFFDAVKPLASRLPVVQGELQMHAIGCYSVGRSLKASVRRAEHGLIMAERCGEAFPDPQPPGARERLEKAWEKVLFNQFHDTYGGTAIPAAFQDALDQLGAARDEAESVLSTTLYRKASSLPPEKRQRILVFNASECPFQGFVQWEPWLGGWKLFDGWLEDPAGGHVPLQILPSPSVANMPGMLLWPARLAPRELRAYAIMAGTPPSQPATDLCVGDREIENGRWRIGRAEAPALVQLGKVSPGGRRDADSDMQVVVLDDPSDTWSHGIDRFAGAVQGSFVATAVSIEEKGPVRASLRVDARFQSSTLSLWARLYAHDPRVEIELLVDWREKLRVAKLVFSLGNVVQDRLDGIPGGAVRRPQDGRKCPVVDWTLARFSEGGTVGVAMPDCSALDGTGDMLRLTLVRSPAYSWHDPARLPADRIHRYIDQGEHTLRITILPGAVAEDARRAALALHRPPVCIDWTRGM